MPLVFNLNAINSDNVGEVFGTHQLTALFQNSPIAGDFKQYAAQIFAQQISDPLFKVTNETEGSEDVDYQVEFDLEKAYKEIEGLIKKNFPPDKHGDEELKKWEKMKAGLASLDNLELSPEELAFAKAAVLMNHLKKLQQYEEVHTKLKKSEEHLQSLRNLRDPDKAGKALADIAAAGGKKPDLSKLKKNTLQAKLKKEAYVNQLKAALRNYNSSSALMPENPEDAEFLTKDPESIAINASKLYRKYAAELTRIATNAKLNPTQTPAFRKFIEKVSFLDHDDIKQITQKEFFQNNQKLIESFFYDGNVSQEEYERLKKIYEEAEKKAQERGVQFTKQNSEEVEKQAKDLLTKLGKEEDPSQRQILLAIQVFIMISPLAGIHLAPALFNFLSPYFVDGQSLAQFIKEALGAFPPFQGWVDEFAATVINGVPPFQVVQALSQNMFTEEAFKLLQGVFANDLLGNLLLANLIEKAYGPIKNTLGMKYEGDGKKGRFIFNNALSAESQAIQAVESNFYKKMGDLLEGIDLITGNLPKEVLKGLNKLYVSKNLADLLQEKYEDPQSKAACVKLVEILFPKQKDEIIGALDKGEGLLTLVQELETQNEESFNKLLQLSHSDFDKQDKVFDSSKVNQQKVSLEDAVNGLDIKRIKETAEENALFHYAKIFGVEHDYFPENTQLLIKDKFVIDNPDSWQEESWILAKTMPQEQDGDAISNRLINEMILVKYIQKNHSVIYEELRRRVEHEDFKADEFDLNKFLVGKGLNDKEQERIVGNVRSIVGKQAVIEKGYGDQAEHYVDDEVANADPYELVNPANKTQLQNFYKSAKQFVANVKNYPQVKAQRNKAIQSIKTAMEKPNEAVHPNGSNKIRDIGLGSTRP